MRLTDEEGNVLEIPKFRDCPELRAFVSEMARRNFRQHEIQECIRRLDELR